MNFKHCLGAVALCCFSAPAFTAIVSVNGDNVRFTYDDATLYGSANVVGDTIFFLPTGFSANAVDGASTMTSESLNVRIEVLTPGMWLDQVGLLEQGDYFIDGAGASVDVAGDFTVTSNGMAYSDTVALSAGPLTVQNATTNWSISETIVLADTAGWSGDMDVDVDIENDLTAATTSLGEQANVQKKFGGVGVSISVVPVPAAVWLFGSALAGLAGLRRVRR